VPRSHNRVLFTAVFATVVLLSLTSLVIAVFLAMRPELSIGGQQMLETCSTCWKLGFGAIVGLIGGKAA
jgi:hypothetical protein